MISCINSTCTRHVDTTDTTINMPVKWDNNQKRKAKRHYILFENSVKHLINDGFYVTYLVCSPCPEQSVNMCNYKVYDSEHIGASRTHHLTTLYENISEVSDIHIVNYFYFQFTVTL